MKKQILKILCYIGILLVVFGIAISLSFIIYYATENNSDLQSVLTTIIAAVYGGLLTLGGVILGLKINDDVRKNELIDKAKPYLQILDSSEYENDENVDVYINLDFSSELPNNTIGKKNQIIYLSNVGDLFLFESIKFNTAKPVSCAQKLICYEDVAKIVLKNIYYKDKPENNEIIIFGKDKLNNKYSFKLNLSQDKTIESVDLPVLK